MKQGALSDYFQGIGTKILSGTEIDPLVSNGHELQGISDFRIFLGSPSSKTKIPVTYIWLSDEAEASVSLTMTGTWYDSRRGKSHRDPEYRLYYPAASEEIIYRARTGDRLFLCLPKDGPLLTIFCPANSSIEQQLLWLFGLKKDDNFEIDQIDLRESKGRELDIVARQILEFINIDVIANEVQWLDKLLHKFGNTFPSTAKFSEFARQLASKKVDSRTDPDHALLYWMDLEERLFLTLEHHIVGQRLKDGFISNEKPDVEAFIKYSLGVQNRRKSRAGWALANHVEAILKDNDIIYCREATTEKRNGPDFLFPSEDAYHNQQWPSSSLAMLGVKTSCKDRWRQVLSEANRITHKHLLTLEPGISTAQTNEMRRANMKLVIPASLHGTYQIDQRSELLSVSQFLSFAKNLPIVH